MSKFKFTEIDKKVEKAMREAVRKVVEEHRKIGASLAVWKNGKVVHISAKSVKFN